MLFTQFQVSKNAPIHNPEVEAMSGVAEVLARDSDSEGRKKALARVSVPGGKKAVNGAQ